MQNNSINSASEINDNRIDILRVKYGEDGPNRCTADKHLLGSILVCWFVAAKPCTYCKYCLYSLSIFCCLLLWRINVI